MKVKDAFRVNGQLTDRDRGNLERFLLRGPAYNRVAWSGREVNLYWGNELVSRVVGGFGTPIEEIAALAKRLRHGSREREAKKSPVDRYRTYFGE